MQALHAVAQKLLCHSKLTVMLLSIVLSGSSNCLAGSTGLNYIQPAELFSKCHGDCSITIFGGKSLSSNTIGELTGIEKDTKWSWDEVYIAGGAVSRTVAELAPYWSIDLELGAIRRFGRTDESEFWGAAYFRWKHFPWNDTIYTTVGASSGLSYATDISKTERKDADGGGSKLLHYFSPEITFAAPQRKDIELVFRLQHRSGVFGLFNGVHGGDHFGTIGLRFKF